MVKGILLNEHFQTVHLDTFKIMVTDVYNIKLMNVIRHMYICVNDLQHSYVQCSFHLSYFPQLYPSIFIEIYLLCLSRSYLDTVSSVTPTLFVEWRR